MSVWEPGEQLSDLLMGNESPHCFYCGTLLARGRCFVQWSGYGSTILLHPHCAAELGAELLGDAREARLAQQRHGEQPYWSLRTSTI